jgi:drug/metabolite transporter (DMT)-like permease
VIGVAGGLLAALLWGTSAAVAALATRRIGSHLALAWGFAAGLIVVLPFALLHGAPEVGGSGFWWVLATVVAVVVAVLFNYMAYRHGAVSVVVPIMATGGAIAALIAVATGESLAALGLIGLAVAVAGTLLVIARRHRGGEQSAIRRSSIAFAVVAAVLYGVVLFASERGADEVGTAWLILATRVVGFLFLAAWLSTRGAFRLPGRVAPYVVFCGFADAGAFGAYTYAAARDGVAVPAVLSSQWAAVATLIGVVLLRERLTPLQLGGVVAILAGVTLVALARA